MADPQAAPHPPAGWRGLLSKKANLAAFALLFLITLPLLTKIFTSDFGTHIAIGRQIVQTRSVADREFLNYPSLGLENRNSVWLFQTILYLVFSVGGPYAVSFLCWAAVLAIFLLLHRSTVIRGADPFVAVLAIFAFSGFLRIRIQPRPELFTYLFIAATIYLLTEYFFGARKKLIYLFPALLLVWANTHATYLMAFLLCGAFFVDGLARAAWNRQFRWDRLKTWVFPPIAVGAAGIVLCGLNPNGYEAILAPLVTIFKVGGAGGSSIMASISELTPVKQTGMYTYYKAAAAFAAVCLVLGAVGRRVYLLDLFLFAIAFKGSWDAARAVSMMGLFLSPGASLQLTGFLEKARGWFGPKAAPARKEPGKKKDRARGKEVRKETPHPATSRRAHGFTAIAAGIAIALLVFGGTNLAFSFSQLQYGLGMTEHKFSFAAADFLKRDPVPGKMFNFFDIGGFLDWQLYPGALTFIDGRTYNQEVFMEHQIVTGAMPGWEGVLRKYGITYAVLKTIDSSGMVLPIIPALSNQPDWSLVFADGLFVVFVRNAPETRAYIQAHEIPKSMIPQQIIWESYHYMYLGVSPVLAYQTMSNMYQIMGNRPAAIAALKRALEDSEEPYLRARLMQLEGRQ